MNPGQIVLVNWRDAIPESGEPSKVRPGIVVSANRLLEAWTESALVVPLTGSSRLAIDGVSLHISPTRENGCNKPSYALSHSVQGVPRARITETRSRITPEQLQEIRAQIAACVGAT